MGNETEPRNPADVTRHPERYVDDYLHELLSPAEAEQIRRWSTETEEGKRALSEAQDRLNAMKTDKTSPADEKLIHQTLQSIQSRVERQRKAWKLFRRTVGLATAASILIIGCLHFYFYHLAPTPYDLQVLGQRQWLTDSVGALRVVVYDRQQGRMRSDVPIELSLLDPESDRSVTLASFQSGQSDPSFQIPAWEEGRYQLKVSAVIDGRRESILRRIDLVRSWRLMLSTDKPVYQPGQTIHVRALALRRPDLRAVDGQQVTFKVIDPKGNIIFKQRGTTSSFGISSIDCPLATEILHGTYHVECQVGDTISERTVRVERYVLPKFKVGIQLDKSYYAPGETVSGTIDAHYFFGQPVAGARVVIQPRGGDFDVEFPELPVLETSSQGRVQFQWKLPQQMVGRLQERGNARVQVVAQVTDAAGQMQSAAVSRVVTSQPIQLQVIPESPRLLLGSPNTIYVYASYADGKPAQVQLAVNNGEFTARTNELGIASFEVTPQTEQIGLTCRATDEQGRVGRHHVQLSCLHNQLGFLVRSDKAVYEGGETITLRALGGGVEPIFIDLIKDGQTFLTRTVEMKEGRGEHQIDLPPELFGTIRLEAYRMVAGGLPVRQTQLLLVRQASQINIQATLNAETYRPGQSAQLSVSLTDATGKPVIGAISLSAVDEAVFSVLTQATGMEQTFFLLEQELLKPVYAIYNAWTPDLGLEVVQQQRNEFHRALFARTVQLVEQGRRRFRNTRSSSEDLGPRDSSGRKVQVTYASAHTLSLKSFPAKRRVIDHRRREGLAGCSTAWTILALSLFVVSAGAFAVYRPKAFLISLAATLGTLMTLGGVVMLLLVMVTGSPKSALDTAVRMGMTGDAKTDSKSASKSKSERNSEGKDGGAGSRGQGAIRVRQWFPETLLWQPELITDDQGRAQLTIPLADSITDWRLSVSAVSSDGKLGSLQSKINVFQPFFVDLNLPVSLTRGDEVGVPVVVYNYLDRPQTVRIELQQDDWFTRLDSETAPLQLELEANQVRSLTIPIRADRVGTYDFTVTAQAGELVDVIRKSIEVIPDGTPVEQTVSGDLQQPFESVVSIPQEVIPGSVQAVVKLHPSSFSQLVEGLDSIFRKPYGCFEQTSSTTYPNVLALDYLRRNRKSAPEIEAKARQYIHLGYQRLVTFEIAGGGFDWFGNPPANPTLSAYGLMQFEDMARVHDVDPNLINRTRRWLLRQRRSDGSWRAEDRPMHDGLATHGGDRRQAALKSTAYIAWAVFQSGKAADEVDATLDFLLSFPAETIEDPYVLACIILAIEAMEPGHREVQSYITQLVNLKKSEPSQQLTWWEPLQGTRTTFYGSGQSAQIESTSMAAMALIQTKQHPASARQALRWLVRQKDPMGTWHNTQATVLALKALVLGTGQPLGEEKTRKFEIRVGDAWVESFEVDPDQFDVVKQVSLSAVLQQPGQHRLTITELTDGGSGYQFAVRYHTDRVDSDPQLQPPLTVEIDYEKQHLKVDEAILATATVVNQTDRVAPMVILDLPIPSGFAIDAEDFQQAVQRGDIAKFQVTPRQVIVYLRELTPGKPLNLPYRLRATMPVKITVPGSQAYEYYDPQQRGQSQSVSLQAEAT